MRTGPTYTLCLFTALIDRRSGGVWRRMPRWCALTVAHYPALQEEISQFESKTILTNSGVRLNQKPCFQP